MSNFGRLLISAACVFAMGIGFRAADVFMGDYSWLGWTLAMTVGVNAAIAPWRLKR